MSKTNPLLSTTLLVRVLEKHFQLREGSLREPGRAQPVCSFRWLGFIIAQRAGISEASIARGFNRDKDSVRKGLRNALRHVTNDEPFWRDHMVMVEQKWREEASQ